jgi:FkbM family methyltransferase
MSVVAEDGADERKTVESARDWQRVSAGNAWVFVRSLLNTLRLAKGPAETARVLRLFVKVLVWRLAGRSGQQDETLRLQGVTHVFGQGTGELLIPAEVYWNGGYDRLADFVPQAGWIVFDVGANAGVYTVQQARRGAYVFAFEPNPDCCRRLRTSIRLNNLEGQVTATGCALGAVSGSAELRVPEGLTTMGSLRPEWTPRAGGSQVEVEVQTLDQVVRSFAINRIDLLKIDVEGLELDVLHGACQSLHLVDRLIIEYHSIELGRRVIELLAAQGLTTVLDEKLFQGDEDSYKGVGRGLLFVRRQAGSASGRSGTATAVA